MRLLAKKLCEDVLMDCDALRELESGLGTGDVIVMNKETDSRKMNFFSYKLRYSSIIPIICTKTFKSDKFVFSTVF